MRQAHLTLLVLAFAAGTHAADPPTNNAALRVLTGQTVFTVVGKERYGGSVTAFKMVFEPGGRFASTQSSPRSPGTEATVAFLSGPPQVANVNGTGHKSVRNVNDNTADVIDGTNLSMGAATLGLKGVGPGTLKWEDGRLKSTRLHRMFSDKVLASEGAVTFDSQGRIARIDWRPIHKPGVVPPGHDAFLRTTYRYEAGEFAPGLPSGWFRESFVDGKVIDSSETILSRFVLSADFSEAKAKVSGPPVSGGLEIPATPLL